VQVLAGGTGEAARLATEASVTVLSPVTTLSVMGGSPVEVNWIAVATTNFAAVRIIFDVDQVPDNGNELIALDNVSLSETSALLDTTDLRAATYFIGVVLFEHNEIAAFGYAPGQLVINQRSELVFTSPRDIMVFDRSPDINPLIEVAWILHDPDSTVRVEVFLDPDNTPNGNEFLLRRSDSQTGDDFTFNLPTASFEPGTYRILAVVSDGLNSVSFYAPGSIRLRARLAGFVDLRDLGSADSPVEGAIFEGFNPRDNLGSFVSSARDIDGDGFSDFLMVAQFGKPQFQINRQRAGIGEAYLVYGRASRFSGAISVNSTGTLFRGEVYGGPDQVPNAIRPSRGITSFAVLSDWDGDTVREFAFGVPFTDSAPVTSPGSVNLAVLDAPGYFRSGCVVIAAGSSLRPDLGFPGGNVFKLSEFGTLAHVPQTPVPPPPPCPEGFFGPKTPRGFQGGGSTFFHRHLVDVQGTPNRGSVRLGCRLSTNDFGDQCGETISAYQFDSIIISVPNRDSLVSRTDPTAVTAPGAGVVSIYYDFASAGFYPWTNTQAPPAAGDYPGTPDNPNTDLMPHHGPYHYIFDDFRLSVGPGSSPLTPDPNQLFPLSPGYTVDPDDSDNPCERRTTFFAPNANTTIRIFSTVEGARLSNVSAADDFNGDGLQDLLIGAPFFNNGGGATFIVFGRLRDLIIGGELDVAELALPLNAESGPTRVFDGIQILGAPGTRLGQAQAGIGDFNNDGLPDVAIGSPLLNDRRGGVAVVFGSRDLINLTDQEIPLVEVPERGLGVVFVGEGEGDLAGARVASAGDVDADGSADLLIAAPNRSVQLDLDRDGNIDVDRQECGVVYLIYGSADLHGTLQLADVGTERLPGAVFIGRHSGDHLGAGLGEQGDRSTGIAAAGDVDGDGHGDLLLGSVSASPRARERAGEVYLIYGIGE